MNFIFKPNYLTNITWIILYSFLPLSSNAQNNNEKTAQEMYENIMSPYCPGRTLSACPSEDARVLRERILTQLNQGYSTDAVYRQLQAMFGKDIYGEPKFNNFGIIAWVIPFILILFCIYIVITKIRRSMGSSNKKELQDFGNIEQELLSKLENKE